MKIFINYPSPFARKVRIAVRELGLAGRTEEVAVVPVESAPDLVAANPVAQIPALIDDDGQAWTGSSLICQYLSARHGGHLLPDDESARWAALRLDAAADALIEMNVRMVLELRRPESDRSAFWMKRWEDNLRRGLAAIEAHCPGPDTFHLGAMTLAVAATYTDFRFPHIDWRVASPKVAALQAEMEKRPSFIDTFPK